MLYRLANYIEAIIELTSYGLNVLLMETIAVLGMDALPYNLLLHTYADKGIAPDILYR